MQAETEVFQTATKPARKPLPAIAVETQQENYNNMKPAEKFAKSFYDEKEYLLKAYFDNNSQTQVGHLIKSLDLSEEKSKVLFQIVNGTITDVMYTTLLALDGCASMGGEQEEFKIVNEDGKEITHNSLEGFAYKYFYEKK